MAPPILVTRITIAMMPKISPRVFSRIRSAIRILCRCRGWVSASPEVTASAMAAAPPPALPMATARPGRRVYSYRTGTATSSSFADGTTTRINPQAYYYRGPFGALAEYVRTDQDVRIGNTYKTLTHDGFTAYAAYVLTGEDASFDGVKPANNFNVSTGGIGAWEVLARYGELHLDDASFPTFADATRSVSAAYESTAGLNWYVNPSLKINANFAYTEFDKGAAGSADREPEKLLTTRAQFRF